MEMLAVIEGLRAIDKDKSIPADEPIEVYSDSAYIVNCFKDGWYKKWQKNGWTNSAGKPVENKDLWEAMISLVHKRNASLKKVKGHANDELNNRCDELAKKAVWRESK
jgi:ribonuclease HI